MVGRPTSAPTSAWPPRTDFASKASAERVRRQMSASRSNDAIHHKLSELYGLRESTFAANSKRGQSMDCQGMWRLRTSIYADEATLQRQSNGTGVPKTLAVAGCAGCGRKSYYKADGVQMRPCSQCQKVFYCSQTCEALDRQSHQQVCNYNATGQWSRVRPTEQYWTVNRSMAVGRQLLRKKDTLWSSEAAAEASIRRRVSLVAQREAQADAQQRHIEQRHTDGLDGPRPCQFLGGKNIVTKS